MILASLDKFLHLFSKREVHLTIITAVTISALIGAFFYVINNSIAAGVPNLSLPGNQQVMLGQNFSFTATFDNNTGTNPGFGPFVDLVFPVNGYDGAAGTDTPDGIDFVSASYLGTSLVSTELTFPDDGGGTGDVEHPYAVDASGDPVMVNGTAGDKLVVLQLPFGSFIVGQTAVNIDITASLSNLADVGGTDLTITGNGGFQFGNDAANNPSTDPSIIGTTSMITITPVIFTLSKAGIGNETEIATGPNEPDSFSITVDIAPGLSLTNFEITDALDNVFQYQDSISTSPVADLIVSEPSQSAPQNPPNNEVTARWNSIVGGATTSDLSLGFDFFIPELDADSTAIIPPATGGCTTHTNSASASATWTPIDTRDGTSVVANANSNSINIDACALDQQKSVSVVNDTGPSGASPGDTVEYTVNFSVSDFFAVDGVVITDIIDDGLSFDGTFTPTLSVNRPSTSGSMNIANFTASPPSGGDGSETIEFRISDELIARTFDGDLLGGCVPGGGGTIDCGVFNNGSTTSGTLVYRATIQESYDIIEPVDSNVDQGDVLANAVSITANVLNTTNLTDTGNNTNENSSASVQITGGILSSKIIYAVNGSTSFTNPVKASPGDTITYAVNFGLTTSDIDDLMITDYVPLPVFDAAEITTFDTSAPSATVPAAGTIKYGVNDTFSGSGGVSGINPTFTATGGNSNTLELDYGDVQTVTEQASVIEVYFTISVSDEPFADGLMLTNTATAVEANTQGATSVTSQIVQFELQQPNVEITKGIVATDNGSATFDPTTVGPVTFTAPGTASCERWSSGSVTSNGLLTNAIQSDISGIDSGDLVTFAIVLENKGSSNAFDVTVADAIPTGFAVPAGGLNICVTDGAGTTISTTAVNGGDTNPLIENGLILDDGASGSLPLLDGNEANGTNLVVITYDLEAQSTIEAEAEVINTATLSNFAGDEGATNHIPDGKEDSAMVSVKAPTVQKTTAATNVTIGESFDYVVTITVPEGTTSSLQVDDTLDAGLAFVDCVSVVATAGLSTSLGGGFGDACLDGTTGSDNPQITNSGSDIAFDLGTVTNSNTDGGDDDTITITYTVIVEDIAGNTLGANLNNSANVSWTNGNDAVNASNVTIILPDLTITKGYSSSIGDAGDTITITLTVDHSGTSNADAYDLSITDAIPTGMTYVAATVDCSTGSQTPDTCTEAAGTVSATFGATTFTQAGGNAVITFDVTIDSSVDMGEVISNTGAISYTTVSGAVSNPSPYTTDDQERTLNENDQEDFQVHLPGPVKSIADSSESHTTFVSGNERLAIGEVARYRLVARVAEGDAPALEFDDNLRNKMRFLDDGTAMVAFVSNDSGMTSSTLVPATISCDGGGNPDLVLSGNEVNLASLTPECPLPGSAISPGSFSNGTNPVFALGDIVNADRDSDEEYIVIEFNALVVNVSNSQSGDNLQNSFEVSLNSGSTVIENSSNLTSRVVEPVLSLTKTVSTTGPYDAGDQVDFQLVLTNTATGVNGADAFDQTITDSVDSNLTVTAVQQTSVPGYATLTDNTIGNAVDVDIDEIQQGDSVTLTIQTTVNATAPAGLTISNTGNGVYTSLPGAAGTTGNSTGSDTPGATGTETGERNGVDGVGGALNDYAVTASDNLSLSTPTIAKQSLVDTTYTIGEDITFDLLITLPEGNTQDLVVLDNLPSGLTYVSHSVITTAAGSTLLVADYNGGALSPTVTAPGGSGVDASFDFGTITTTNDNVTNNNSFVIQIVARIVNELANQNGVVLVNAASLDYTEPNGSTTATVNSAVSPSITVVEPILDISKTISTLPSPAQAGETVEYTVVIDHNAASTADAFDVLFTDLVPSVLNSISVSSVNAVGITPPTSEVSGNTVRVPNTANGTFDLPQGASVTIVFTAVISNSATPSQLVTNTGGVIWSSLDGADPNERDDGTGAPDGSNLLGSGSLDDYEVENSAGFTVTDPGITKSIISTSVTETTGSNVTIGEVVSYQLDVPIIEGTTPSLTIIDDVPAGMAYVSGSLVINEAVFGGTLPVPTITAVGGDGVDITVQYTTSISNPEDANSGNDFVRLTFDLVVLDVVGNSGLTPPGQSTLSNSATSNTGSGPVASNNVDVTVVEPRMIITKTIDVSAAAANDPALITLVIQNTGTAAAFDVSIEDILPSDMTYVGASLSNTAGIVPTSLSESSGTITVTYTSFASAGSSTITFSATVDSTATQGQVITNTATVDAASSISGINSNERDVSGASDNDSLTVTAVDLTLTKDDGTGSVTPGNMSIYTLGVTNNGDRDADGVTFTETVPVGTTFDSANSTVGWSCLPNNNPGSTCTLNIGSLAVSASQNVFFSLIVDDPADVSGQVVNNASVADDGSHGDDANPADNTASDTNTLTGGPTIDSTKTDVLFTDADSSSDVSPGDTIEYTIVVTNTGNHNAGTVVLSDTPDANTSLIVGSVTTTQGTVTTGNTGGDTTVQVSIGELVGTSGSATITYQVIIDNPVPSGTVSIQNQGSITGSNFTTIVTDDPDTGTNDDPTVVPLTTFIDLQITKTPNITSFQEGNTITYDLTITNIGNITASGVAITDTLPAGVSFNSASDGGSFGAGQVTWPTVTLAGNGGNISRTLLLDIDAPYNGDTDLINTVVVTDDGANGADANLADNTAESTITLSAGNAARVIPQNISVNVDSLPACTGQDSIAIKATGSNINFFKISEDPSFTGVNYQGFFGATHGVLWQFSDGDGPKTAYLQFKSSIGYESTVFPVSITVDQANNCGEEKEDPEDPEEPEQPDEPEDPKPEPDPEPEKEKDMACIDNCQHVSYDVYIVNPDGSERHMNTNFTEEVQESKNVVLVKFEDKGLDFDYNDVWVRINKADCENIIATIISRDAGWDHSVRMKLFYKGIERKDILLWESTKLATDQETSVNVQTTQFVNLEDHGDACEEVDIAPCAIDCEDVGYDLFIVNPDGTERHTGTDFSQLLVEEDGVMLIKFEDKAVDFDYNDVWIRVDKRSCSSITFSLVSVDANWHHQVKVRLTYRGRSTGDILLWADSHRAEASAIVNIQDYPSFCASASAAVDATLVYEYPQSKELQDSFIVNKEVEERVKVQTIPQRLQAIGVRVASFFTRMLFGPSFNELREGDAIPIEQRVYLGEEEEEESTTPIETKEVVAIAEAQPECALLLPINESLQKGIFHPEVTSLQELLQCLGYFPEGYPPSTYFGGITEAALLGFQAEKNIPQSGFLDNQTKTSLNEYLLTQ